GFVSPNAPCVLAPHAEERRRGRLLSSIVALRCVSKHEGTLARPHPSRRAHARSKFAQRLRPARSSGMRTSIAVFTAHDFKQPISFPRRIFCVRGLRLSFPPPESRGGRSAEKRSGARRSTRRARHNAAYQAPSEAPCVP